MKHPKIPQTEVLEWLYTNHPALHACAEIERDWVWLAVDLRGDHNKPIREAIKEYSFIFHRKGGHLLPSGKLGIWGTRARGRCGLLKARESRLMHQPRPRQTWN